HRQADDGEVRHPAGDVDLDGDAERVDAEHGGGLDGCEHARSMTRRSAAPRILRTRGTLGRRAPNGWCRASGRADGDERDVEHEHRPGGDGLVRLAAVAEVGRDDEATAAVHAHRLAGEYPLVPSLDDLTLAERERERRLADVRV